MTQLASQQVLCEIPFPHWPLFTIPPSSSSPAPSRFGAANVFPLFMRHPLEFPIQPFSFSLAFCLACRGPRPRSQYSSTLRHQTQKIHFNFSFLARFVLREVLQEQNVIIIHGCMNKTKVKISGLIAVETSDFTG